MANQQDTLIDLKNLLEHLYIYKDSKEEETYREKLKSFLKYQITERDAEISQGLDKIKRNIEIYRDNPSKNFEKLSKSFIRTYRAVFVGKDPDYNFIAYYLPLYAHLFAQAFRGDKDLEDFTEEQQDFLRTIVDGLSIVVGKLLRHQFCQRFMAIQLHVDEKDSHLIRLHDRFEEKCLTLSLNYNQFSLDCLLQSKALLRKVIVEQYKKDMPFLYLDEAFRFYALYTPLKLYLEGVLEPQLSLKNVDKLPLVALILPEFQKRYFKDSLEKLKNYQSEGGIALIARENPVLKVPSTADKVVFWPSRDDIQAVCDAAVKAIINYAGGALFGPVGSMLAPVAGVAVVQLLHLLINSLFGSNTPPPITMEQIRAEIAYYLRSAEGEIWTRVVWAQLETFLSALAQRYDSIKAYNQGVEDQSKWKLDAPANWESVVNAANSLKSYIFDNKFAYHYQCSLFVNVFLTQYTRILTAKIYAKQQHGITDYSYEIDALRDCYIRASVFIEKLMEQAWNESVDYLDFRRELTVERDWGHYMRPDCYYSVCDNYNFKNYPSIPKILTAVSESDCRSYVIAPSSNVFHYELDYLEGGLFFLETMLRSFTVQNCCLESICACLDELCLNFNKYLAKGEDLLPTDHSQRYLDNRMQPVYKETYDRAYNALVSAYSKKGVYLNFDYGLPYRLFKFAKFGNKTLGVGDYAALSDLPMPKNNKEYDIVPMGTVIAFSKPGFKGIYTIIDKDRCASNGIESIKSMRVRLNFNNYNNKFAGTNFSRIPSAAHPDSPIMLSDLKTIKNLEDPWKKV